MHYSAAELTNITAIITRNTVDFAVAEIPVLTPNQWLDNYRNK